MAFTTKPCGIHANFESTCWKCGEPVTVTNTRPDRHECERPVTLEQIRAALQAR